MNNIHHVQKKLFHVLLVITIITLAVTALINLINQRPVSNIIIPLTTILPISLLLLLSNKFKKFTLAKHLYLAILFLGFLPIAWLTSPGSYSAMPYYTFLIITVAIALVHKKADYLWPLLGLVIFAGLNIYQGANDPQFNTYQDPMFRSYDLIINFTLAVFIMGAIFYTISNNYLLDRQHLYDLSTTDQLTGLKNRRHLLERLEMEYNHAIRMKRPFVLLMIDLNNFKRVNDEYGHLAGDDVLAGFGDLLLNELRSYDIGGRYGGDEFMVILPDTSQEEGLEFSKRITALFKERNHHYEHLKLGLSIGIASGTEMAVEELISFADSHLYRSKRDSKKA